MVNTAARWAHVKPTTNRALHRVLQRGSMVKVVSINEAVPQGWHQHATPRRVSKAYALRRKLKEAACR